MEQGPTRAINDKGMLMMWRLALAAFGASEDLDPQPAKPPAPPSKTDPEPDEQSQRKEA
jgi:hypothetical protein